VPAADRPGERPFPGEAAFLARCGAKSPGRGGPAVGRVNGEPSLPIPMLPGRLRGLPTRRAGSGR
jgi:hypothetical protein